MPDTMLVGIDGSEGSQRAARFAAQRAKVNDAKLVVAYVIEWSRYSFNTPEENEMRHKRREEEIETARTRVLQPLLKSLEGTGVELEGVVRHGHPAEVLQRLALEYKAVQVFICRIGSSNIKSLLFGSIASNLVQTSEVPVTVVP